MLISNVKRESGGTSGQKGVGLPLTPTSPSAEDSAGGVALVRQCRKGAQRVDYLRAELLVNVIDKQIMNQLLNAIAIP